MTVTIGGIDVESAFGLIERTINETLKRLDDLAKRVEHLEKLCQNMETKN